MNLQKILPFVFLGSMGLLSASFFLAENGQVSANTKGTILYFGLAGISFVLIEYIMLFFDRPLRNIYPEDINIDDVSIHEAGHILIMAFSDNLVEISASIGSFGGKTKTAFIGKTEEQLLLLHILAGVTAEEVVLGFSQGGAKSDMLLWHKIAKKFLVRNKIPLDKKRELIYRQKKWLLNFFHINMDSILGLAEELHKKKKLTDKEIIPYLENVKRMNYDQLYLFDCNPRNHRKHQKQCAA